jgi:mono/diheme cytochrome c family protein
MRKFLWIFQVALILCPSFAMAGGGGQDSLLWTVGYMPVQMLIHLTVMMAVYVGANYFLKKIGKGIPAFPQAILIWLGTYAYFKFAVLPPLPSTLLYTFMGLVTIVIFLFVSSTEQGWTDFKRPILSTIMAVNPMYKNVRRFSFVVLPLLIGYGTYDFNVPKFDEPIDLRTVHPAPPASTTVRGQNFTLQTAQNPYRVDDNGEYLEPGHEKKYFRANAFAPDAPKFLQYIKEGGSIFFQNCHFCHGDNLNGQGMFAFAFVPIPANFVDPGTLAQLQETFVFWRIAKGGPGLPTESAPWASAMPPWEEHLTTDEIWKVNMFEYWHTEFFPRTWE